MSKITFSEKAWEEYWHMKFLDIIFGTRNACILNMTMLYLHQALIFLKIL